MEDHKRWHFTRNVYRNKIEKAKSELEVLIESQDYVAAETKVELIGNFIVKLEEINENIGRDVADEDELKLELQ